MRVIPFEYGVRNLGRSPLRCALALLGSALVLTLILTAAGFVRGMERALAVSGRDENVIILGAGSEESVERSEIDPATPGIVSASIQGIQSRLGQAYLSPASHVQLQYRLKTDDALVQTALFRGVTPAALLVHPQVRVDEGRMPRAGQWEVMVGRRIESADATTSRAVGTQLWIDGRPWTIVGRFEAPGTVMEAEIWCPLSDLQIATKRTTCSCVVLTLGNAEFADVDAFCKQRLDLQIVAMRESDYYAKLAAFFGPIRAMVWGTAALIAMGGLFGGLNTMYAAFAARIREFAALQTLGFSRAAILLSLVQESIVITCAGAMTSCLIALLFLKDQSVQFSMGTFGLAVDPQTLGIGIASGLLLGMIGAALPAWRCLRLPIAEALRAG